MYEYRLFIMPFRLIFQEAQSSGIFEKNSIPPSELQVRKCQSFSRARPLIHSATFWRVRAHSHNESQIIIAQSIESSIVRTH
jgi:hypothetical protein